MSLAGEVLIKKANLGIGAAIAIHLVHLGASLSITGRNKDDLYEIAKQGQCKAYIVMGELINERDTDYRFNLK